MTPARTVLVVTRALAPLCAFLLFASACSPGEPEAVAAPQPSAPAATPTPLATPTPVQAPQSELSAIAVNGSGLMELRLNSVAVPTAVAVLVDGELRAVNESVSSDGDPVASVWVPPGNHDVCLAELVATGHPSYWDESDIGDSPAARSGEPIACTTAEGTIAGPPRLFPGYRVAAYYGSGATEALGVMGEGTPAEAADAVVAAAAEFASFDLPVLPAFEYIATIATAKPGDDNMYSKARPPEEITPYLREIRRVGGIMVLDLQPGRNSFADQMAKYEHLLREPDIHLALDPEWSMEPDERPGPVIGSTDAETINDMVSRLQALVVAHGLPQKLLIVHTFYNGMIEDPDAVSALPGVAVMYHIDGQGDIGAKNAIYDELHAEPPLFNGFKISFDEDARVQTPEEIVALDPAPVYVSYQ